MTTLANDQHSRYERAPRMIRDAVDAAYKAAREVLEERGFEVSNTDPAEILVGAIFQYIVDSASPDPLPSPRESKAA